MTHKNTSRKHLINQIENIQDSIKLISLEKLQSKLVDIWTSDDFYNICTYNEYDVLDNALYDSITADSVVDVDRYLTIALDYLYFDIAL